MEFNWSFWIIRGALGISALSGFTFLSVNLGRSFGSLSSLISDDIQESETSEPEPEVTDDTVTQDEPTSTEPTSTEPTQTSTDSALTTPVSPASPSPKKEKVCKTFTTTKSLVKLTYYNPKKGGLGAWYIYKKQANYQANIVVDTSCKVNVSYVRKSNEILMGWNYVYSPGKYKVRYTFEKKYYYRDEDMKNKLITYAKIEEDTSSQT